MTEQNDDKLRQLAQSQFPAPAEGARRRALEAAMLAYDAAEAEAGKESARAPQGGGWGARLRSIVPNRSWIMDTRITMGLGTAAVALLLLPLGYQLYSSTAFTPMPMGPGASQTSEGLDDVAPGLAAEEDQDEALSAGVTSQTMMVAPEPAPVIAESESPVQPASRSAAPKAVAPMAVAPMAAAPVMDAEAPASAMAEMAVGMPEPSPVLVRPTEVSGDQFTRFAESPVKLTSEAPVSTFSIDVDTASYAYVRRSLNDGFLPAADAVRIEELINYFDYDYAPPADAGTPFSTSIEVYPTPWKAGTQLVQIGIRGYVPPAGEDKPSNLVFLLDTSGSMDEPDKLPLLKRAFALLVNQLGANDTVSIVAYAGSAGVVLPPTKATDRAAILAALENLAAGGSTAGAEGIELAYQLAEQNLVSGGINRVILATDGDFNVGIEDPQALKDFIAAKRDAGVSLSVLGFGQGNYGDDTMQALAQNGNGNASYIDSFREAQKVLVEEIGGTLETIAKDVKIQVEFNPAVVAEYRLIGYETRALNREDFNNDRVDAGEIGAGHTVTAIYEITPVGSGAALVDPLRNGSETPASAVQPSEEIGFLKLRYKAPDGDVSKLIETPITEALAVEDLDAASDNARWASAVAAFGQKLKGSSYGQMSFDAIEDLARSARGTDENGYRAEFLQLVRMAQSLTPGEEFTCTAPEGNRNCN